MLGDPMVYGNPIELGAQILLHLPDKIAREGFEVRHFHGVVGRDNETEMVPVVFAPLCERLRIGIIGAGAKQPHLLSVPGDALRSEEHTSELQSLMRISYAVLCLKKKNTSSQQTTAN